MPSEGGLTPARVLPPTWRPAPWIGDEPVTATERLLDALERRMWAWDLVVVYGALLGLLTVCVAVIVR
jgi:hypothetical protein